MAATGPGYNFWQGMSIAATTFSAREITNGMVAIAGYRRNDRVETFPTAGWDQLQTPKHRLIHVDDATVTETTGALDTLTGLAGANDRYFPTGVM